MRLFQREQRSLFGEILDWMLTPLLLLWPVSLALTWVVAQSIAAKPFDRALEHNVHLLAQRVAAQDQQPGFDMPRAERSFQAADDTDQVFHQVRAPKGDTLGGERDMPAPPDTEPHLVGEVRLRDDVFRDLPVRVGHTWVALPGGDLLLVQVAETRDKRSVLATEIIKGVMLPQFVILPLAVLLVWLALVRGIKPLSQLEERIRARRPDDLSPLDEKAVPLEVAPLVSSVNDLLTRLKESISLQKRFLAGAAHQLKTPLAGLRMQADLAQREDTNAQALKQSLKQIGRASMRATHTVNQLLSLARAEASGATVVALQGCDLAEITQEAVLELLPRALDKRIDLGYDGPEPGDPAVRLHGNRTLLKEIVVNLLDNALNYTPSSAEQPGVITARLVPDASAQALVLQVEDTGPGIPASERELVFQPFYRALGTNVDGSGLGLSIVREIARQHGAEIRIDEAHPGATPPGTRISVRFTAREPAAAIA
ncbi:sensor histidine kinase [Ramlibacter rhizophilus]|uniref:histidine kinase n=1 Tax=Ramlibacter rhizophilus TaxID=1781167 RepID=A0A4Z0BEY8_9BURK|nr:sensor histidine kinase [Ramlibacter rhizophilus]TFY97915.1 sensor histidine kinase [Ramlibacter rhizophilus]